MERHDDNISGPQTILRLVVKEVTLDQKRRRGHVWIKIVWQTGSTSEHWFQRTVQSYVQHAEQDELRQRVTELNGLRKMDGEIAAVLNAEEYCTAHGPPFSGKMVHLLRKRWQIATVKINGEEANPPQWPDGSYSVQGAAALLGITPQTIFDWLRKGCLRGQQLARRIAHRLVRKRIAILPTFSHGRFGGARSSRRSTVASEAEITTVMLAGV